MEADFVRRLTDPGGWILAVRRLEAWAAALPAPSLRSAGAMVRGGAAFLVEAATGNAISPRARLGADIDLRGARNVQIAAGVELGDRCRVGSNVMIGTDARDGQPSGQPKIGNDVIIESRVRVMGPIVIGDRAVIRANSLVIADVPAGAVVAGVPARGAVAAGGGILGTAVVGKSQRA